MTTPAPDAKPPAWKAWTYQRRLQRYASVNPEPPPPALPGPVITATVLALVDIRAGRRSWRSLEARTTPEVQEILRTTPATAGRLRRIRVCRPDAWSVEVAAVVTRPERSTALALRWDWTAEGWTLTAVEG